jgi:hypothetical protein
MNDRQSYREVDVSAAVAARQRMSETATRIEERGLCNPASFLTRVERLAHPNPSTLSTSALIRGMAA